MASDRQEMKLALRRAVDAAAKRLGSRKAVAAHFKHPDTDAAITPQALAQWEITPPERVLTLEALSGVSRYELRPDIYGAPPKAGRNRPSGRSPRVAA